VKLWSNNYWPIWLLVTLATFLGPEGYALASNAQNTLSDWVWRQLKITQNENPFQWSATDYLIFGLWIVLVTWLTWHFFFRKFT
jgi:hypothetical protein